jgi:alpha-tubulin suppressor-like RCC1 family protein
LVYKLLVHGQVGHGHFGDLFVTNPRRVRGALLGRRVAEVCGASEFALAVTEDGLVFAWGTGTQGQLGPAEREPPPPPPERDTPAPPAGTGTQGQLGACVARYSIYVLYWYQSANTDANGASAR